MSAGLIEVREFMARFVDQEELPSLEALEAAFADPGQAQQHMQVRCTFTVWRCRERTNG